MLSARCPWYIAGPLIGLLMVAIRWAVNRPLGALGGYIDVAEGVGRSRRFGFSGYLLIGTVAGGALYQLLTHADVPSALYAGLLPGSPAVQTGILLVAGFVMGLGARTAGGCTSGHGLTGVSLGSPASLTAAITFFGTAVVLSHLLAWLSGGMW